MSAIQTTEVPTVNNIQPISAKDSEERKLLEISQQWITYTRNW